jgi:hypothetical protein
MATLAVLILAVAIDATALCSFAIKSTPLEKSSKETKLPNRSLRTKFTALASKLSGPEQPSCSATPYSSLSSTASLAFFSVSNE